MPISNNKSCGYSNQTHVYVARTALAILNEDELIQIELDRTKSKYKTSTDSNTLCVLKVKSESLSQT